MVLNNLRYISDKLIEKPVNFFIKINISPNTLSYFGFVLSMFAALCFALNDIFLYNPYLSWVPPMLYFISAYFDLLDGGVARKSGKVSKFGGFLDSTLDRIADASIIIGIMYSQLIWPNNREVNDLLAFMALTVSIMISYTRSRAENEGVYMKGVGFMERGERFIFLILGYIIEANRNLFAILTPYNYDPNTFYRWYFILFIILCTYTLIARILHARRWLTGRVKTKFLEKHGLKDHYRELFPARA